MAEANETPIEETPKPAEADKELKDKLDYFDKELKKVIKERDTAKGKLKEIDDKELIKKGDYEKILKEKEDLITAKETELLDAKKKADAYDVRIEKEKKKHLDSIKELKDDELYKIAEKLELDDLEVFSAKLLKDKDLTVDSANSYKRQNNKDKSPQEKMMGIYKS